MVGFRPLFEDPPNNGTGLLILGQHYPKPPWNHPEVFPEPSPPNHPRAGLWAKTWRLTPPPKNKQKTEPTKIPKIHPVARLRETIGPKNTLPKRYDLLVCFWVPRVSNDQPTSLIGGWFFAPKVVSFPTKPREKPPLQ